MQCRTKLGTNHTQQSLRFEYSNPSEMRIPLLGWPASRDLITRRAAWGKVSNGVGHLVRAGAKVEGSTVTFVPEGDTDKEGTLLLFEMPVEDVKDDPETLSFPDAAQAPEVLVTVRVPVNGHLVRYWLIQVAPSVDAITIVVRRLERVTVTAELT